MTRERAPVTGISKAFLTDNLYPDIGDNIAVRSLRELQDLQNGQSDSSAQLIDETQRSRAVAENMIAPLLRNLNSGLTEGNGEIQARLRELQDSFTAGNQRVGDQISGIPGHFENIAELLSSGAVDEAEIVILAAKGVLNRAQAEFFFRSLPEWKIGIIASGLVTVIDIQAEQALNSQEKVFLAKLRRKTGSNPLYFASLATLAANGLLDANVHHSLAEKIPDLRYGVEGVKYEVRDLNLRTATLVEQGEAMLRNSHAQIELGGELVHQGSIGITQRNTALRLMRAGILQTEELARVAGESLTVQQESLAVQTRSLQVGEATLAETAYLANLSGAIVQNTGDIARGTNSLVDFASALVAIEAINRDQLAGISRQMDVANRIEGAQLQELSAIKTGLEVSQQMDSALLQTSNDILDALGDLRQTLSLGIDNLVQVIDVVRQSLLDMDARAIGREQNSEMNLAQQSFRKAMKMLEIGQIDKAIKFFNESEDRWPADFRVYFQRGLCYVLKNDPRSAEDDFSDAIKLASAKHEVRTRSLIRLNLARLYYSEAKVHFDNGDQNGYEEKLLASIEEAKRATEEDPKFLEAKFALATYLAAYKLFDEALKILVRIIPKNPNFVGRLEKFEVFTPLRELLSNTLGEGLASEKDYKISETNLNIAKDCIKLGDFEMVKKCLNFLFEKDPEYLRQAKIWELPEFAILNDDIIQMTEKFLVLAEHHDPDWTYVVIGIALHLAGISRGSIFSAFKIAIEKDPDFLAQDSRKITEKCVVFATDKVDRLFTILLTKVRSGLPEWFLNSLKR